MWRKLPATLFVFLIVGVPWLGAQSQPQKTLLDGVYTEEQALRGSYAYAKACLNCHGAALEGVHAPRLVGDIFVNQFREAPLIPLYSFIKQNMPPDRVGGIAPLTDAEYMDLVAHILKVNGYPAGTTELTPEIADVTLFVGKNGPQPPPDGALVLAMGCLTQLPTGQWVLSNATMPVRAPTSKVSTEDLKAVAGKPLGAMTIRLADLDAVQGFSATAHKGQTMQARGYYIGQQNAERINLMAIGMVSSSCASK